MSAQRSCLGILEENRPKRKVFRSAGTRGVRVCVFCIAYHLIHNPPIPCLFSPLVPALRRDAWQIYSSAAYGRIAEWSFANPACNEKTKGFVLSEVGLSEKSTARREGILLDSTILLPFPFQFPLRFKSPSPTSQSKPGLSRTHGLARPRMDVCYIFCACWLIDLLTNITICACTRLFFINQHQPTPADVCRGRHGRVRLRRP